MSANGHNYLIVKSSGQISSRLTFLLILLEVLSLTLIIPLLPFYSQSLGASPFQVGLIMTAYPLFQFFSVPLWGSLSDKWGRKPALVFCQIGSFLGLLLLSVSNQLWMIFLSRAIDGMTAGNLTIMQAQISDQSDQNSKTKAFGKIGIAFGIGFLVGPAISGLLSSYDLNFPLYAAAALSFLSLLFTSVVLPHSLPIQIIDERRLNSTPTPKSLLAWNRFPLYFKQQRLRKRLLEYAIFCLASAVYISGFALFLERRLSTEEFSFGAKQVGYLFAYAGLLGILTQGMWLNQISKKIGEKQTVPAGFFSLTMGFVILPFVFELWQILIAMTLVSLGMGILRPALTSLISQETRVNEQGVVLGLAQSLNSLAQVAVPPMIGYVIYMDWLHLYGVLALLMALAGLRLSLRETIS